MLTPKEFQAIKKEIDSFRKEFREVVSDHECIPAFRIGQILGWVLVLLEEEYLEK